MILARIQETVDKYVNVLYQILKVNIEVIDSSCNVISSSDQSMVNSEYEGFIYKNVLKTGEKKVVEFPGKDPLCSLCPQKDSCIDTYEIHNPIKIGNQTIGVICFSCVNEEQRKYITDNYDTFSTFIDQISELISLKAKEALSHENTLFYLQMLTEVVNLMEQCISVVNYENQVISANEAFLKLTNINREKIETEGVFVELVSGINQSEYSIRVDGRKYNCIGEVRNLKDDGNIIGKVLIFTRLDDYAAKLVELSTRNENLTIKDILGDSPQIIELKEKVDKIANSMSTILITGESGTGKEMFARAIHSQSHMQKKPFIAINCSAIPETLLESELFGYVKGAFTGADPKGKMGKFELANGGVLFLDEIGDMPLYLQAKLLRVLEDKEIVRLGSNTSVSVDVRIIAATNKNLAALIAEKKFREDLYYRLNVLPLFIPPLRERREDIRVLTDYFLIKYSVLLEKIVGGISEEVYSHLENYSWPGNVRELENTLEYIINMIINGEVIKPEALPSSIKPSLVEENALSTIEEFEKQMICQRLIEYGNSLQDKEKIAESLGISIATLYRKIKKYGLQ